MLDKSMPYVELYMHRPAGTANIQYTLPDGYSFTLWQPGDEREWARIETSVAEFDREVDALLYFQRVFGAYPEEAKRRCMFICTPDGEKIATASAWWDYNGLRRECLLHWVAVMPTHQGRGLGKAVVGRCIDMFTEIEGDRDVYLHTQTWSHKAVGIYMKAGFAPDFRTPLFGRDNARVAEALEIIGSVKRST